MEKIVMEHGNGGRLSSQLIDEIILPSLGRESLNEQHDSALLNMSGEIGLTSDNFVINPYFFSGGDIGKLSVCGTINDLVVSGCKPRYLSLGLIIEEGFLIEDLKKILVSIKETADKCKVKVVTGDTKVIEKRGEESGIFINTTGVGDKIADVSLSRENLEIGDKVITTGTVGEHGIAILCEREGVFQGEVKSDCYPLVELEDTINQYKQDIKIMRDPTRGGIATTLNEFVEDSGISIELIENNIPIKDEVQATSSFLGLDPLYSANEGKALFVVSADKADEVLASLQKVEAFKDAAIIGEVTTRQKGNLMLKNRIGARRILGKLSGDMFPRIC